MTWLWNALFISVGIILGLFIAALAWIVCKILKDPPNLPPEMR